MITFTISDYQIIKNAHIEVDGIGILLGKSDQGKSALIRAVYAAIYNQSGDSFINESADRTEVRCEIGTKAFTWIKEEGSSGSYLFHEEEGDRKIESTGRGSYEELVNAGFSPIEAGPDEFHLQFWGQHEPFFLLLKPKTRKFQILASIFESDKFDTVLKNIKSDRREVRGDIKDTEAIIDDTEEEIETKLERADMYEDYFSRTDQLVEDIEESDESLSEAKKLHEEHNALLITLNSLRDLLDGPQDLFEQVDSGSIDELEEKLDDIQYAEELQSDREALHAQLDVLEDVTDIDPPHISGLEDKIEVITLLGNYSEITRSIPPEDLTNQTLPDLHATEKSVKDLLYAEELHDRRSTLLDDVYGLETDIQDTQEELEQLNQNIQSIEERIDICPYCGNKV